MTWKKYLNKAVIDLAKYLREDVQYSGISDSAIRQIAWREIEIFVENYKNWPQVKLILNEEKIISDKDRGKLSNFFKKRLKGIPLAYILKKQRFFGLDFEVSKNTLIPRPETEEMVDYVLKQIKKIPKEPIGLIDIGTGSGCIITAILKNISKNVNIADIWAIDASKSALKIARENTKKHLGNKHKIKFIQGSLLSTVSLKKQGPIKYLVMANLPYLSQAEYHAVSPEVGSYEPKSALVGGDEGHELITQLIDQTIKQKINFELFLEISPTIYPLIRKHCEKLKIPLKIKKITDMSNRVRILHLTNSVKK